MLLTCAAAQGSINTAIMGVLLTAVTTRSCSQVLAWVWGI